MLSSLNRKKSDYLYTIREPIILLVAVVLSRLPFLNLGYGTEEDSWGTPLAIWNTLEKGLYEPSRLPGHPVQEFLYLLVPYLGAFAYNIFSTIACSAACLAFFYIFKKLNFSYALLSALALAFTPVVYISSTYTIDYCFTLCFLLWAFYSLLNEKYFLTGLFLSLAIGCRITSAVMILPFSFWINIFSSRNDTLKSILKTLGTMLIFSLLFYLPLIYTFGYRFFQYYDQFPYPSIEKVIYKATFGVWGVLGLLGVISAGISQLIFPYTKKNAPTIIYKQAITLIFVIIFLLYLISYIRLPQKSGYWIPIIPYVLLFLRVWMIEILYIFCCICLLASSFFFSLGLTDSNRGSEYSRYALVYRVSNQSIFFDPITGPLYSDYTKRLNKERFCKEIIDRMISQPRDSLYKQVIICGWWYNQLLEHSITSKLNLESNLRFYIRKDEIESLQKSGKTLYYLPEQERFNDLYSELETGFTQKHAKTF